MKENIEKITIIVPIYNVEQYLHRCLTSVVNQSYKNLEIILVNDGSPDKCGAICNKFARNDKRIKVIHQENMGLSGARNTGLFFATGKYIMFLDSDDWISLDLVEYLLNLLHDNNAQISLASYVNTEKVIPEIPSKHYNEICYESKEILQYYLASSTKNGIYSVCGGLYKAEIAKAFKFRVGKINEDIDYKYKVMSLCQKLVISDKVGYFYFQSKKSLSSGKLKHKDFDLYEAADELYKLAKNETYGTISKLAYVKKARTPFSLLCKIAYFGIEDSALNKKMIVRQLTKEHRTFFWTLICSPITFSRKILCVLFAINYKLAEICINIVKNKL